MAAKRKAKAVPAAAQANATVGPGFIASRMAEPSSLGGLGSMAAGGAMLAVPGGWLNPSAWALLLGGTAAFLKPEGR